MIGLVWTLDCSLNGICLSILRLLLQNKCLFWGFVHRIPYLSIYVVAFHPRFPPFLFFSFFLAFWSSPQWHSWQITWNNNWPELTVMGWKCSIIYIPLNLLVGIKKEDPIVELFLALIAQLLVSLFASLCLAHFLSFWVKLCLSQHWQVNSVNFNFICTLRTHVGLVFLVLGFMLLFQNEKKTGKFLIKGHIGISYSHSLFGLVFISIFSSGP